MTMDPNDFLLGGSTPSAKFDTVGTTVAGRIVDTPTMRQQTDFDTGELLTWDNGDPRMQLVVRLATDERDPQLGDDDGIRALYVKGALQKAIATAVRAAGAKGLEVGGTLTVTHNAVGEPVVLKSGKKGNPPKMYTALYTPAGDAFLAAEAAPMAAPAAAPDPAVAHVLAGLSAEQRQALGIPA